MGGGKSRNRGLWRREKAGYSVEPCVVRLRGEVPLQRLFSTFPSGKPGLGLLLMRAALGGISVAFGVLELVELVHRTPVVWAVGLLLVLSGLGLIAGFFTPVASLLAGACVLGSAFSWLPGPPIASQGLTLLTLLMVVMAAAIALLGPGAFSLDGVLFGRREIVIPPRSPES